MSLWARLKSLAECNDQAVDQLLVRILHQLAGVSCPDDSLLNKRGAASKKPNPRTRIPPEYFPYTDEEERVRAYGQRLEPLRTALSAFNAKQAPMDFSDLIAAYNKLNRGNQTQRSTTSQQPDGTNALVTAGTANDTVLAAENPVDVLMSIVSDVDVPAVMSKLKNLCEYVTLQLVKKFLRAVSQKYRCLDPTKEFAFPKQVSGVYGVLELFALGEGEHSAADSRTAQALLINFDFRFKHLFDFGEAEHIKRLYLDTRSDIFRFCFESQLSAVHVHRSMQSADIQWPPDKDRMQQCDCLGCADVASTEHTAVVSGGGATSATTNLVAAGGSTVVVSGGATSPIADVAAGSASNKAPLSLSSLSLGTKRVAVTSAGTGTCSKRAKNTTAAAADFVFATDSDKFVGEEGWTQYILLDEMRTKLQFVKTGALKQGVVYAIQDKDILELNRKHRFYLVMLCSRKTCEQRECTKCPTTKHSFLLVHNKTLDPSDDHWFVHKNDLKGLLRAAVPKE